MTYMLFIETLLDGFIYLEGESEVSNRNSLTKKEWSGGKGSHFKLNSIPIL